MSNDVDSARREKMQEHFERFFESHPDLNAPFKRNQFLEYILNNKIFDLETAYQRMNGSLVDAEPKDMFSAMDRVLQRGEQEETTPPTREKVDKENFGDKMGEILGWNEEQETEEAEVTEEMPELPKFGVEE